MANTDVWDPPEEQPQPAQPAQPEKRWSTHLANNPYGEAGDWALQFYNNPNADPNAAMQNQISQFRNRYGDAAPEDDMSVIKMLASGQAPQAQTPAQSWGGSQATAWSRSPDSQALLDQLMARAKQGLNVSRMDPTIRAQVDPMTAQMERASRSYLDQVAEGAGGVPFNMQGERRMAAERTGQQAGQLESEVIGREIAARRNEIAQSLQLWGGMLDNEQRLALQKELAYLDDSTRRYGISTQNDQFLRDLALRRWQVEDNSDYRWLFG